MFLIDFNSFNENVPFKEPAKSKKKYKEYKQPDYYCKDCDKTMTYRSRYAHFTSLKHCLNANNQNSISFMLEDSDEYRQKIKDISQFSSPRKVKANAMKYGFQADKIRVSNLKTKKWMYEHEGKKIHFGYWGTEDYTVHKDDRRLYKFQWRNHKWKTMDKHTPAYMAYWLLWS